MTHRRVATAALALLGLVGVLLIPSAGGAATVRVRVPRTTTTTTADAAVPDAAAPAADATAAADAPVADATPAADAPTAVIADQTFNFPGFTFGGFVFPGISFSLPDGGIFASIGALLTSVFHSLCSLLPLFCSS